MKAKGSNSIKTFVQDTGALVTVQVVMFSVMLFGGIGLMMDFGRAYSAHSHMQSYIDQVALAAARQLDQTDGAISRATTAADAVAGSSDFVTSGDFSYNEIVFLTGAPTNTNGDYDEGMLSTLNTSSSLLATHVLVKSSNESVALQLLNFASSGEDGIADIALRTQAVATSRTVACGGLSPLVMCNPFEGSESTSFRTAMQTGFRLKLTADITNNAKPVSSNDKIQLGLLKNPTDTMHVRNTACSDLTYLPGVTTMSGASTETLRDICLLATVDTGLSCVNDQVIFKGADPYAVTTGLNVIFDMFDDSMADIMDSGSDPTMISPLASSLGVSIKRSSLFHPDPSASKGRMSREDYAQHVAEQIWKLQYEELNPAPGVCPPGVPAFLCPSAAAPDHSAAIASLQDEAAAYAPDPNIDSYSRQNYVLDIGERNEWGPAVAEPCLTAENCTLHSVVFGTVTGQNDVESYAAAFYEPYILGTLADATSDPNDGWWDFGGSTDIEILVNGEDYATYYDFYVGEEITRSYLQDQQAVRGNVYAADDTTRPTLVAPVAKSSPLTPEDVVAQEAYDLINSGAGMLGLQTGPTNYTHSTVYEDYTVEDEIEERRRQRVTVVNCTGSESYASATGVSDANFDDAFVGDVVDVVDLFMVAPPEVTACSVDPGDDPQSNFLCANQDIASVELDVEFVDSASSNSVAFDSRTFAILVH